MSFLDTIKDRLRGVDDYHEDDYYDEDYESDGYEQDDRRSRDAGGSGRLLGTKPRPEAESISVYTRSGRPVSATPAEQPQSRGYGAYQPSDSYRASYDADASADLGATMRVTTSQLPPYVLRPVSYDDVQTVVQRVRTNQPVVLVFRNTNIEIAKRILDFSFGFSYGVNGSVTELGDRVFAVLPAGASLSAADLDKLVADGDLVR
ncbi:MAG: cell division protein SepF [Atopobiaceae bacterium]|nr:cell division protein SepF [Atopobiaceae bacterium]